MLAYNEKVIEHFNNPRNIGFIKNYDGIGKIGDEDCGDFVEITIKISDDNQIVEAIKFRIKGCPASIATSSITAEMSEGKPIEDLLKLQDQDIVDALGGLPESKVHCSLLAVKGLHLAIQDAILKRLFIKGGIVKSIEEFEKLKAEGKLNQYFQNHNAPDHDCDGSCESFSL